MNRLGLMVSVLLVLSACRARGPASEVPPGESGQPQPPPPPDPVSPGVKVAANDPALLDGPGQMTFKIGTLRQLMVRLSLPSLPSSLVWVTLTLTTPHGSLFASRRVPFTSDPNLKTIASPDAPDQQIDV